MHSIIYHLSLDCRLSVKKPWYNYRSKLNVYWSFLEGRNYSIRFLHVVRFHRRLVMENSREGRGSGCGCIDMRSFFSADFSLLLVSVAANSDFLNLSMIRSILVLSRTLVRLHQASSTYCDCHQNDERIGKICI